MRLLHQHCPGYKLGVLSERLRKKDWVYSRKLAHSVATSTTDGQRVVMLKNSKAPDTKYGVTR
ncbi:glycerophosphoryl diester phosphodiesterase [Vibrio astriarenae]|nr:glycerophosphoryl diester phosphodiesterase [Vibrio sp. C7]